VIARPTRLAGVIVIEPKAFGDRRGYFLETWSQQRYAGAGVPERFVQDNLSRSTRGTIRGLHLQHPFGQGKLVTAVCGEVFDVAVDVRVGSPTFGEWVAETLSEENHRQIYIPPGFAHGFCVLSEFALFAYKCTETYHPEAELGVAWNDPDLAIAWPTDDVLVSARDREHPRLGEIDPEKLPRYQPGPSDRQSAD
jgi:dTDP-4-dehydrorhamnose 3,5-epimerase